LEQGPDIDIEADIGKGGGDDPGAAVVAVLPELDDQHARPAAFLAGESLDLALDPAKRLVALVLSAVDAGDRRGGGAMPGEYNFERVGNLADRRAGPARLDREGEEVAIAGSRRLGQRRERGANAHWVAASPYPVEPGALRPAHRRVLDICE